MSRGMNTLAAGAITASAAERERHAVERWVAHRRRGVRTGALSEQTDEFRNGYAAALDDLSLLLIVREQATP